MEDTTQDLVDVTDDELDQVTGGAVGTVVCGGGCC